MRLSGLNPQRGLVEIVEIPEHPFFIGVQFHPEFKSSPLSPHPIFRGFVGAALQCARNGGRGRVLARERA
jgi:CTP synthase